MQDAVILANCIYDLEDLRPESLTAAFQDYKEQRYSHAKKQIFNSRLNAKLSSGQVRNFNDPLVEGLSRARASYFLYCPSFPFVVCFPFPPPPVCAYTSIFPPFCFTGLTT